MKTLYILSSLLNFVWAHPYAQAPAGSSSSSGGWVAFMSKLDFNHITENALQSTCPQILAVIARGSLEPGNVGVTTGPLLCKLLREKYTNKFGCQGIGDGYSAGITENMLPKGTAEASIKAAIDTLTAARTKCTQSIIVFEGYSQGAALMHNAIPALSPQIRDSITAGVLFGDTKNKQSGGKIPTWPSEKLKIFCAKDDGVCDGGLNVNAGHVSYLASGDVERAAQFLTEKIDAALVADKGAPKGLLMH